MCNMMTRTAATRASGSACPCCGPLAEQASPLPPNSEHAVNFECAMESLSPYPAYRNDENESPTRKWPSRGSLRRSPAFSPAPCKAAHRTQAPTQKPSSTAQWVGIPYFPVGAAWKNDSRFAQRSWRAGSQSTVT